MEQQHNKADRRVFEGAIRKGLEYIERNPMTGLREVRVFLAQHGYILSDQEWQATKIRLCVRYLYN